MFAMADPCARPVIPNPAPLGKEDVRPIQSAGVPVAGSPVAGISRTPLISKRNHRLTNPLICIAHGGRLIAQAFSSRFSITPCAALHTSNLAGIRLTRRYPHHSLLGCIRAEALAADRPTQTPT